MSWWVIFTKSFRPKRNRAAPGDLLFACKTLEIPVVLIVPAAAREKAKNQLREAGPKIHFVAPDEVEGEIRKYL